MRSLNALEVPLTDIFPPDSGIINRLLQQSHGNSVANWVNDLVARIKVSLLLLHAAPSLTVLLTVQTGSFKSLTSSWLSCSSVTQPLRRDLDVQINEFLSTRAVTPLECPLVWGSESNKFVCVSSSLGIKLSSLNLPGISLLFSPLPLGKIYAQGVTSQTPYQW